MQKAFFLLCALVACGPGAPAIPDAGAPDAGYGKKAIDAGPPPAEAGIDCTEGSTPSATYPATHPTMPQVLSYGGPVLAHPRFVPVVFSGEDRTDDIAKFTSAVATSTYWSGVASDYGVGPATASAPIAVDETPPAQIDDVQIQAWLQAKLDGTHADFGAPDPTAIYVLYYPAATSITAVVDLSCVSFLGYHSETIVGATHVVYAVIARCSDPTPMTAITAHELFEAATDPLPFSAPAYQHFDQPLQTWLGQEVGDLCEERPTIVPPDVGYPAVPIWSNVASAAGRDPCQPSATPYFRTMPESPTVALGRGETRTISLVAFSDRPSDAWTVSANADDVDWPDRLSATLCRATAQNGERIPITITRPNSSEYPSALHIVSTLGDVTTTADITVVDE
ncbi:MAG TPA: hypothetical protein VGH28_02990 [Polyangiaceae bacterium]